MLIRTVIVFATVLAFGTSNGWADAYKARHHRHAHMIRYQEQAVAPPYSGTLVLHPRSNIACDTIYRATRAIPCDQPVWVYGSPCEIDLGLGRYRSCE
jgi:hypothetical protein